MRWGRLLVLYGLALGLGLEWSRLTRAPARTALGDETVRPRFLTVELDGIHEVRIVRAQRLLVLQRWEGQWGVAEPRDAPIPVGLIEAFVRALADSEQIERVAGPEADGRTFGLDEDAIRVELRRNGALVDRVLLGAINPTGTAIYARRSHDSSVYLIGRNVAYYEGLLFQALPPPEVPAGTRAPVGG